MNRDRPASLFDPDLSDLPPEARWREWMGRVEALIFAAPEPVPRQALAKLVGASCKLDDLIADIQNELRARPYELVFVAGGWQLRTRSRFADAIRGKGRVLAPELNRTEHLIVTAIAYMQPVTRLQLSQLIGKEVSRDLLARLKRLGLVAAGPRVPAPGAPATYVTTKLFLSLFDLGSLRDLPALEDESLLSKLSDGDADRARWTEVDKMLEPTGTADEEAIWEP